MTERCLEMVRFTLAEGADRDAFLAGAPALTDWASRQPGFQSRTLVEHAGGGWLDIVCWASKADAERAADRIMYDLGQTDFMKMIDPMSVEIGHHPVAHSGPGL
ncbi:MAG: hypothetical protein AAF322_18205 [Pseudomonadota bacterium]